MIVEFLVREGWLKGVVAEAEHVAIVVIGVHVGHLGKLQWLSHLVRLLSNVAIVDGGLDVFFTG